MKPFFEKLFRYNQHCNKQLADIFEQESTTPDEKSVPILSQLLNAPHTWNNRILERNTAYGVWDNHTIETFTAIDRLNHEETRDILATCDLANEIAYQTTTGKPFVNTIHDTLFHVINHSTYHRGQLALLFRQSEIEPLATDYIRYKQ